MINFRARLQDGAGAWDDYRLLLVKSTLPNLFDDHPPFQIDGNFGAAAGLFELLVQSHRRTAEGRAIIDLLPALPPAVPTGSITGLRARGGITIERLAWRDGRLAEVVLTAPHGASVVLCHGDSRVDVVLRPGERYARGASSAQSTATVAGPQA